MESTLHVFRHVCITVLVKVQPDNTNEHVGKNTTDSAASFHTILPNSTIPNKGNVLPIDLQYCMTSDF